MDGLNSRMKTEESGSMKAELKLFSLNRRKKKRSKNFFFLNWGSTGQQQ